jgi:hypothetical protein
MLTEYCLEGDAFLLTEIQHALEFGPFALGLIEPSLELDPLALALIEQSPEFDPLTLALVDGSLLRGYRDFNAVGHPVVQTILEPVDIAGAMFSLDCWTNQAGAFTPPRVASRGSSWLPTMRQCLN